MIEFEANPSFTFATTTTNKGTGDADAISAGYWLSKYQTTNDNWAAFVAASGGTAPKYFMDGAPPDGRGSHPVLGISAEEFDAYCTWLTEQHDGWTFRRPTEAEWENAARERGTDYPWGDDEDTAYSDGVLTSRYTYNGVISAYALANYDNATYNDDSSLAGQTVPLSSILQVDSTGGVDGWIDHDTKTGFAFTDVYDTLSADGGWTTPVGSHADGATPSGLLDVVGNAYEWTSSTITANNGIEAGAEVTAVRGGSWYAMSRSCTTTYRGEGRDPAGGYNTVGARVAAVRS